MRKAVRIIVGITLVSLVLHMADLATRDCRVAPYVYDDCMWMGLRSRWGLPASRFLRMVIMESVGIILAFALYLAFRYVFPFRRVMRPTPDSTTPLVSEPPKN
jgi:hypothetical protein